MLQKLKAWDMQVNCDMPACQNKQKIHANNIHFATKSLKLAGWKPYKNKETGEWCHMCPACRREAK